MAQNGHSFTVLRIKPRDSCRLLKCSSDPQLYSLFTLLTSERTLHHKGMLRKNCFLEKQRITLVRKELAEYTVWRACLLLEVLSTL